MIVQSATIPAAVDGPRAAFATLLALVLGGLLVTAEVSPTLPVVLAAVLGLSFFVANAFDPVREHQLYHLGKAAWAATMLGLLVATGLASGRFAYLLFAVACLALGVEAYNYRHGTAYLRVDTPSTSASNRS